MGPRRSGGRPRFFARRRVCSFCVGKVKRIDYKNFDMLRTYVSDRSKMDARRKTGTCAKHQRLLATAIKRARFLALLPASPTHFTIGARPSR
ncbi:MAG: 30S ribosomal protein S18 [SAR202 cluster bacterium]|nr:30S ribosomal protein S18 [SAR202 cluster bacterium]